MSAGGLAGMLINLFWAAALWTGLGWVVDIIGNAFNEAMASTPMLQDAVDAFALLGWAWSAIMVIIFFALGFNYVANEATAAGGEQ